MEKRKIMGIGLSALLFLGITGSFLGLPTQKNVYAEEGEETEAPLPDEGTGSPASPEENPDGETVSLTAKNAELFLPDSYEQYLPLENPSYMAMSEDYIAIADGTLLYVYDREQTEYSCYDAMMLTNNSVISKVQISDDGQLFFSAGIRLYKYNFETGVGSSVDNVPCNTFLVEGEYLYTSYIAANSEVSLKRYPLSDISPNTEMEIITVSSVSTYSKLAAWNGILYCVRNDRTISTYDMSKMAPGVSGLVAALIPLDSDIDRIEKISDIQRVCAYDGYLYYSVYGDGAYPNGLWRTDIKGNAECLIADNGFSAINYYNGNLYCIRGTSILQLDVTDEGVSYTGYEIAASSMSENRLMNATDAVRARDLLVIADAYANRVSVYNQVTKSYTVIDCEFSPTFVATDGETIAVAGGKNVYTFQYGESELKLGVTEKANIVGIACVYGSVYYVTLNSNYGKVGEEQYSVHNYKTPQRVTSDLYGNIYVSNSDGEVYRFTEEEFLSENTGIKLSFTLPKNYTSLRADFEGNLYCLSGNVIYKNGKAFAAVNGNDFVYSSEENTAAPVSFALGFEDSEVYLLFGNYAVKSHEGALEIPTLNKIITDGIADEVFAVHGKENLLIDVPAKTVGVKITLSELKGAEYFPYESYYRLSEDSRGVLLGATERYYLVLLPDGRKFTASLFQINQDYLADEEEYWAEPNEEENKAFYLSSGVSAYYAPCLETALRETGLRRGASVSVIGYVTAPDLEYALVCFFVPDGQDASARSVMTGYVPKSFLTSVSPLPDAGSEYMPVYLKASEAGILFSAEDGEELLITERTEAQAYENGDGTYTVCVEKDGKRYFATVDESQIDWKNSDALRIALIIILSTLALLIIGGYIFLLPRKAQKTDKANKKTEKKE